MAERAEKLMQDERYEEAGRVLDSLLSAQKDSDGLWYLRGMLSLKLGDYDAAMESLERALWIRRKPEYYRLLGMANLEVLELDEAMANFRSALEMDGKDAVSHFFLSVCYMFLNDIRSGEHIRKAYSLDRKRTAQLVRNFYQLLFGKNPMVSLAMRRDLEKRIKAL